MNEAMNKAARFAQNNPDLMKAIVPMTNKQSTDDVSEQLTYPPAAMEYARAAGIREAVEELGEQNIYVASLIQEYLHHVWEESERMYAESEGAANFIIDSLSKRLTTTLDKLKEKYGDT